MKPYPDMTPAEQDAELAKLRIDAMVHRRWRRIAIVVGLIVGLIVGWELL
jgi:hypothetical protein